MLPTEDLIFFRTSMGQMTLNFELREMGDDDFYDIKWERFVTIANSENMKNLNDPRIQCPNLKNEAGVHVFKYLMGILRWK